MRVQRRVAVPILYPGDSMLKSGKFFGHRDIAVDANAVPSANSPPMVAVTRLAVASIPRALPASITSAVVSPMAAGDASGSKLTVGPNIKLKGVEITDCDTLVVEGTVEATINSRMIQIAERGAFIGNAEFDVAEIRGEFSGDLTVRQKLVVHASGRVSGKVRYGRLVIEEGGQLSGDVQLSSAALKGLTVAMTSNS
jgi:cytoskeletal protein CcmA (bactofilin family)